jgi:protein-disulfide isomerase
MFGLPTPLFGMAFYASVAALLVLRSAMPDFRQKLLYRLTMLAALAGITESAYLTYIQAAKIGSWCTWCLASAVCAALLFIIAIWDRPIVIEASASIKELKIQFIVFLVAAVIGTISIVMLTRSQEATQDPTVRPAEVSDEGEDLARTILYREGTTFEGPEDAAVTLIEFVDFECPTCALADEEVKEVRKAYEGRIRFGYRHFPLPIHKHAVAASRAVVCADTQGALFPYAETLFENRLALEREDLVRYAAELRLDLDAFVPCLDAQKTKEKVERDLHDGDALGVAATPTFFVNTTMIDGLPNAEQLSAIIDGELGGKLD